MVRFHGFGRSLRLALAWRNAGSCAHLRDLAQWSIVCALK